MFILIFFLGIITGVSFSIIGVVILIYFRFPVELKLRKFERKIESMNKPKGFIYEPKEEIDEIREKIITENKQKGRDTFFSELYE